jgi:hypothetical protein
MALAAVACLSLIAANANAQVFVNDTFDTYANQAAFEAVWTPIGTVAPVGAVLSTEQAVSGTQSIKVEGTATTGQERNQLGFTRTPAVSTSNQIIFSFDFFDTNPSVSPYRQSSNLQDTAAPTSTNQLVSMGMNNNQTASNSGGNFYMARILGYDPIAVPDPDGGPAESVGGSGAYFKLNDFANSPLRSAGWHTLKVIISTDDGLSTDYQFFVDGILAENVSNVGTAATIRSYDTLRLGSGVSNASNAAYFDNMHVEVQAVGVPEPSSLAFGFAASALAARLVRRRRV